MRLSIVPDLSRRCGGPSTFQANLTRALVVKQHEVALGFPDYRPDAILVVNASRHLVRLWQEARRGTPIIQRLGGLNWMHRDHPFVFHSFLKGEGSNLCVSLVRRLLADSIVYQSRFVKRWWERAVGCPSVKSSVIYNGVDLSVFCPGEGLSTNSPLRIISVEGTLHTHGDNIALRLVRLLRKGGVETELDLFGRVHGCLSIDSNERNFIKYHGTLPNSELVEFYRKAHLYISTDVIAACPNSALEALACGTPILGYLAGALPEILNEDSGICAVYPGDPWNFHGPDTLENLAEAAMVIFSQQARFRQGARNLALSRYGLETMVNSYLQVIEETMLHKAL